METVIRKKILQQTERCADCGGPIGQDRGPPDGWQLEDGRTVCHVCCVADAQRIRDAAVKLYRSMRVVH